MVNYLVQFITKLFLEIIASGIYEILNIFDIDITPKEDPGHLDIDQKVSFLEYLYKRSKSLCPQLETITSFNQSFLLSSKEHNYQYQGHLTPSKICILSIQPDVEENPIECTLHVRDLNSDNIEAALSYVWGTSVCDVTITVDGSSFCITPNLYDILRKLRLRDGPREIWVDAICIDQSDPEEKDHQVRLMRDIYSKTKETIIWLGDWPPEHMIPKESIMEKRGDKFAPVPKAFRETQWTNTIFPPCLSNYSNIRNIVLGTRSVVR
ncbi:heterokaryon incompatibility protein-domain-containing protein [Xylaria arbuscula]|nr:heterokaryon incompatibility protein-domain-containing protein [Xylaria arbuscula]